MSIVRRNKAAEEISRDDPRFKCRMCGNPIFGVDQSDKNYSATFYCSKDCQDAHTPHCISMVCINVMLFIPSGWVLAFLISGNVPVSMVLGVVGLLVIFLIVNIIVAYQALTSWDLRRQIIRNRMNTSRE